MTSELSGFYLDMRPSLGDQGFAKKPRQSHWHAYLFCEPSFIKISAHLFGTKRSLQMKV
jgi:hypothetical protein